MTRHFSLDNSEALRPVPQSARNAFDVDPWYLIQLKPGGFERAQLNFKRQNVTSFMPVRAESAANKRAVKILKPLFPGYLFLQVDTQLTSFRTINSTYGVSRLVMRDSRHAEVVPFSLIAELKERCDCQDRILPPKALAPGQKIRITSGPFKGFIAEVEIMSGPDRVRALFDLLGRRVRTDVMTSDVELLKVS